MDLLLPAPTKITSYNHIPLLPRLIRDYFHTSRRKTLQDEHHTVPLLLSREVYRPVNLKLATRRKRHKNNA
jgi:hypothetical protein